MSFLGSLRSLQRGMPANLPSLPTCWFAEGCIWPKHLLPPLQWRNDFSFMEDGLTQSGLFGSWLHFTFQTCLVTCYLLLFSSAEVNWVLDTLQPIHLIAMSTQMASVPSTSLALLLCGQYVWDRTGSVPAGKLPFSMAILGKQDPLLIGFCFILPQRVGHTHHI